MSSLRQLPSNTTLLAASSLGLAFLLLIHRYPGINHDALLYLGQVLYQLHPDIFRHDLFFAYGSQDSFTLMPWLVSQFHPWLSLPEIFLWGALLGLLLFGYAAWRFLSRVLPSMPAYWAWLAAIVLPGAYGTIRVFTYGESFFTARPLAEALSLLALGFLTQRRLLIAALFFALAGLLHPLQAIGAILIAWPWLILQDRRWLHLAWLALPVAALGLTPIKPFDSLFQVLDADWHQDLTDFTLQLFVTHWSPADWANLAFDSLLLGYAAWRLRDTFGRWCLAGLFGLLLGVTASLLLADLLQLVLPTALQLWRVQWLAHLLANAAAGVLLYTDLSRGERLRASALALAVVMAGTGFLWTWVPVLALHSAWPRFAPRMTPLFRRTLAALAWLTLLGLLGYHIANEWLPFQMAHERLDLYAIDRRILAFPLLALGLPLLGIWLWNRCRRDWQRVGLLLVSGALLVLGIARWDTRSPVARALEAQSPNPALFGQPLPEHAQVFWDLPLYPAVWVALQRTDYFSPWQLAGSVFNRGTPREGRLRLERVRPIIEEDMYCQDRSVPLQERIHCRISDTSLLQACTPGGNQAPDYLVLPYRQAQPSLGQWSVIDPITGEPAVTFWLYACPTILRELAATSIPHDKPNR